MKLEEKMRKVELLPTRDCEAGYGPISFPPKNCSQPPNHVPSMDVVIGFMEEDLLTTPEPCR